MLVPSKGNVEFVGIRCVDWCYNV